MQARCFWCSLIDYQRSRSTQVAANQQALCMHEQISLLEISLLHRYTAQEAQYMPKSRVLVLFISGTLFGRTFYIVADSPWPNHMDGSGLVSSTMSPPLGATKHGRTLVLRLFGGLIQANCWPTLQQGPDPRFACADGGRGMAQRAALALIEGFRLLGWCLCLFLQLSAENQQLSDG